MKQIIAKTGGGGGLRQWTQSTVITLSDSEKPRKNSLAPSSKVWKCLRNEQNAIKPSPIPEDTSIQT